MPHSLAVTGQQASPLEISPHVVRSIELAYAALGRAGCWIVMSKPNHARGEVREAVAMLVQAEEILAGDGILFDAIKTRGPGDVLA